MKNLKKMMSLSLEIVGELAEVGIELSVVEILFVDEKIVVYEKLRGKPVTCSFDAISHPHVREREREKVGLCVL